MTLPGSAPRASTDRADSALLSRLSGPIAKKPADVTLNVATAQLLFMSKFEPQDPMSKALRISRHGGGFCGMAGRQIGEG